jgi:branched-subunit amino acid ABC-type transport system permease component
VPGLALAALPLVGSGSSWITLTVAGLAMGMIIFVIASGLTLVFGLMDVLNFGHGVFIALGAFVATSVLGAMGDWTGSQELWLQPARAAAGDAGGDGWWLARSAWRSSASSCARSTASTSSRS